MDKVQWRQWNRRQYPDLWEARFDLLYFDLHVSACGTPQRETG